MFPGHPEQPRSGPAERRYYARRPPGERAEHSFRGRSTDSGQDSFTDSCPDRGTGYGRGRNTNSGPYSDTDTVPDRGTDSGPRT